MSDNEEINYQYLPISTYLVIKYGFVFKGVNIICQDISL